MTQAAASIVVTNYNYARFLGKAIDSALSQTLDGVEVIVVDDGSTDESRSVIESYGDAIRPVFKENGGETAAINAGVRGVSGPFAICLDSGDTLAPTAIENAAALFEPGVTRVFWRLWEVDEDGQRTGRIQPSWGYPADGDLRAATLERGPDAYVSPPQSGNAFSTDVLIRACPLPGRDRGTGSAHAGAFLVDLAGLLGRARGLPEPAGTYRVQAANDWAPLGRAAKLERDGRVYDERCRRLERYCKELGLSADSEDWRRRSSLMRTVRAKQELDELVPVEAALTVLDHGEVDIAVAGQHAVTQFPEKNGEYAGPPADDDEAVRALERLREERGGFFAVLWPAFWWFETYPRFSSLLESTAARVRCTEDLHVYSFDAGKMS
jgi:hypothetical protein